MLMWENETRDHDKRFEIVLLHHRQHPLTSVTMGFIYSAGRRKLIHTTTQTLKCTSRPWFFSFKT